MTKICAAFNMTLDGICDHTTGIADQELHQHYADLLRTSDIILYGRKTYQLMEYWKNLVKEPSGDKEMDDFAIVMDKIPKIVFSKTLKEIDWESAKLSDKGLRDKVEELKQQIGKNILVGSRSLIIQLLNLDLIDELQLSIHPIIETKGLEFFENLNVRKDLKLIKTKVFKSGVVTLYYEIKRED